MTSTISWGDPRSIWPTAWRTDLFFDMRLLAEAKRYDTADTMRRARGIVLGHVRARARMGRFAAWLMGFGWLDMRYVEMALEATRAPSPEAYVAGLSEARAGLVAAARQGRKWAALPWQQEPGGA